MNAMASCYESDYKNLKMKDQKERERQGDSRLGAVRIGDDGEGH